MESRDYTVVPFGGLPPYCSRIFKLLRVNRTVTMKAPGGIKYEPKAGEMELPENMPRLLPDQDYEPLPSLVPVYIAQQACSGIYI